MNTFLHKYGDAMIAVSLILVFAAWPDIDLTIDSMFYVPSLGFPSKEVWWIKIVYETIMHLWILAFLFILIFMASYVPWYCSRWSGRRKALVYLLVVLIVEPRLITDSLFKNN